MLLVYQVNLILKAATVNETAFLLLVLLRLPLRALFGACQRLRVALPPRLAESSLPPRRQRRQHVVVRRRSVIRWPVVVVTVALAMNKVGKYSH